MAFEVPRLRGGRPKQPSQQRRVSWDGIRKLFQNEDAIGAALFIAAMEALASEDDDSDELAAWIQWDPLTIKLELQDVLKIPIDDEIFGRLMAAVAIVGTDLFYQDLPAFIEICNTLSGAPALLGVFDPADVYEVAWAVAESQFLDNADNPETNDFSEEIRAYIGIAIAEAGFMGAPQLLQFAIMPPLNTPTDMTTDAELLPGVIESDGIRHEELLVMLQENTLELVRQVESVVGKLDLG